MGGRGGIRRGELSTTGDNPELKRMASAFGRKFQCDWISFFHDRGEKVVGGRGPLLVHLSERRSS